MIRLKTADQINTIAEGGAILATIVEQLRSAVGPGITTKQLDAQAAELMQQHGVKPAFLGYHGYPAVLCTSVNHRVVHGIPSADEVLREGDIIGLDLGILYRGFYTDMAITVPVGAVTPQIQRFVDTAEQALNRGIDALCIGRRLGAIGAAIQEFVERRGYGVVRDLTGHGVGQELHEAPSVPNFGSAGSGPSIQAGLVIAIEPMITAGDWHVKTLADGWTVETVDQSRSAHFEHTVAVTESGVRILTLPR